MSAAKVYSEFSLILFIIDLQKLNFLSRGNVCVRAQLLSHMQLFAISWTWATRLFLPWNFPGKNTGMGCHFLLQEILPTQGSNPRLLCLLHCRWILYPLNPMGSRVHNNPGYWNTFSSPKANRGVMLWNIKPRALETKYKLLQWLTKALQDLKGCLSYLLIHIRVPSEACLQKQGLFVILEIQINSRRGWW